MTEPKVPENFNALYSRAARAARGVAVAAAPADRPAVSRMAGDVPDLTVDYDEATQNPVRVSSLEPTGRLSAQPMATPEAAARQFVKERADVQAVSSASCSAVVGGAKRDHRSQLRRPSGRDLKPVEAAHEIPIMPIEPVHQGCPAIQASTSRASSCSCADTRP